MLLLYKHVAYRASFSRPGVMLRVSVAPSALPAFVVATLDNVGGNTFEIHPAQDGVIEFRPKFYLGEGPAELQIWRDSHLTGLGTHAGDHRFWEPGMEFRLSVHPKLIRVGGASADAGVGFGGCFAARNGPAMGGTFNGCILGFESMTGGTPDHLWELYAEPRARVIGRARRRTGWATEAGAEWHFAAIEDPAGGRSTSWAFGLGAYIARDLQTTGDGPGWRVTLDYRREESGLSHSWYGISQFGIGRYW